METAGIEIPQFTVLTSFADTRGWLQDVCRASDAQRNELGFFPNSVFEQFARQDGLYVLITKQHEQERYAGHVLFDRRFPRAHVRQMFVVEAYRRSGAASLLLKRIRSSLEAECFISVYARVAEDLSEANAFWEKQGFYVQRKERGGSSRNRQILVRCLELNSPQLFPPSGINHNNPLGVIDQHGQGTPMFLLDLNVLFDVQPRRLRRASVVSLFQAERMNLCRLAISEEVRDELKRSLNGRTTDPMAAYIDTFPCLPIAPARDAQEIFESLAGMIFGRSTPLSANEQSDINHLITAIRHDLAGFVTNDAAILAAGREIESRYGLQVVSTAAFELEAPEVRGQEAYETGWQSTIRLSSVSSDHESNVRQLLTKIKIPGSLIASEWLPTNEQSRISKRYAVWSDPHCIGYVTWSISIGSANQTIARAVVDESHDRANEAAGILLLHLIDEIRIKSPRQVILQLPRNQSVLREASDTLGFFGSPGAAHLTKVVLGAALTVETWQQGLESLASSQGLRLPSVPPNYIAPDQSISLLTPTGNRANVPLYRIESLLSPALLCLPGRPAVITPIQSQYADPLLGHSGQGTLLPRTTASLHADKIYIGDRKTIKHLKRGTLIFFYESSRAKVPGEVIALARVRESYLRSAEALDDSSLKKSVLRKSSLRDIGKSDLKTVTVFDNIFHLPNPVSLQTLKELGCGRPTDLITTRPLTEEQAQHILAKGFERAR
jgi:GNAT superfamily N-acetyltransferase